MEATNDSNLDMRQELDQATNSLQQCKQQRTAALAELAAHLRAQGEARAKAADVRAKLELLGQEFRVLADTVVVLRQVLGGDGKGVSATMTTSVMSGRATGSHTPVGSAGHIAGDD